jgi:predicted AAA+ superfamily ATPase
MDIFWEMPTWIEQDQHLRGLRNAPFARPFPSIEVNHGPALFIVRGPRQVGKSTWLKTLLAKYKDPSKAFYLSCENVADHHELAIILKSVRHSRTLILLDEVSFVREWTRAVKHEIDSGYAMEDLSFRVIISTGGAKATTLFTSLSNRESRSKVRSLNRSMAEYERNY